MPAKFKESEVVFGKNRRKIGKKHFYLRNTPTDVLVEAVNNANTKPKHKQKFCNELVKRGLEPFWVK